LKNLRAAEMALWESTGGDVLNAESVRHFPLSIIGIPKN
jgi:hypothetical protein